jgi:hypothetical protein
VINIGYILLSIVKWLPGTIYLNDFTVATHFSTTTPKFSFSSVSSFMILRSRLHLDIPFFDIGMIQYTTSIRGPLATRAGSVLGYPLPNIVKSRLHLNIIWS